MTRLKQGDPVPDLPAVLADGRQVSLKELGQGKDTLLYALRYAGCTFCQLDVHRLIEARDLLAARNMHAAVLMQSDQAHLQPLAEDESVYFDLLSDPQGKLYEALEIMPARHKWNLAGSLGSFRAKQKEVREMGYRHGDYEGNELQLPAAFVFGADGLVHYAWYCRSLTDLPTPQQILSQLESAAQ